MPFVNTGAAPWTEALRTVTNSLSVRLCREEASLCHERSKRRCWAGSVAQWWYTCSACMRPRIPAPAPQKKKTKKLKQNKCANIEREVVRTHVWGSSGPWVCFTHHVPQQYWGAKFSFVIFGCFHYQKEHSIQCERNGAVFYVRHLFLIICLNLGSGGGLWVDRASLSTYVMIFLYIALFSYKNTPC
jgi:hypothetical protein